MTPALAAEPFCYLTTTGRRTGQPRRIEIWFAAAAESETIYLLAGGGERAGWVRNLRAEPRVTVEIGSARFGGRGRSPVDSTEDATARRLVYEKYRHLMDLEEWRRTALPVAIDLSPS